MRAVETATRPPEAFYVTMSHQQPLSGTFAVTLAGNGPPSAL